MIYVDSKDGWGKAGVRSVVRASLCALMFGVGCGPAEDDPQNSDTGSEGAASDDANDDAGSSGEPGDTSADADADAETGAEGPADTTADDSNGDETAGTDEGSADTGTGVVGSLTGSITRAVDPSPNGDAIGNVYVAVFAESPLSNPEAELVGMALLENVDMSTPASVTYLIENIPARPEAYFAIAFLDDNGNASMEGAGPDSGDLVSLEGIEAPQVVVVPEETTAFNLSLNAVMP